MDNNIKPHISHQCLNKSCTELFLCNLILALCLFLLPAAVYAELNKKFDIKLPAQLLSSSLVQLSEQCQISILFNSENIKELRSQEISGKTTVIAALTELLSGSGYDWHKINQYALEVVKVEPQAEALSESSEGNNYLEEVEVFARPTTGSHVHSRRPYQASVLQTLSEADLDMGLSQPSAERLQQLIPAVTGNGLNSGVSNGGNGTASLTLRGLPTQYTLILLNGERVASSVHHTSSIDLNIMPLPLASSVEVLANGASAIYGADAVAGAVNIIVEDEFDGVKLSQSFGQSSRNDLDSSQTKMTLGKIIDDSSILLAVSDYKQEGIYSRQRDISADQRSLGGPDLRSSAIPNGRVYLADGRVLTSVAAKGADDSLASRYRSVTDQDLYDFAADTTAILPLEQQSLFVSAKTLFNKDLQVKFNTNFNRSWAENTRAPEPLFSDRGHPFWSISSDNKYNPIGDNVQGVRRRIVEMGPRLQTDNKKNLNVSLGLEQAIDIASTPWHWHANVNWSEVKSDQLFDHVASAAKLQRAAGPSINCQGADIDGCVAINLFGAAGTISSDQLDYIHSEAKLKEINQLGSFSVQLDGDLGAIGSNQPANLALGASYRFESSWQKILAEDDLLDTLYQGQRDISEVFAELNLPLMTDRLDIQVAARYADYSDFGQNLSPSFAALYRPVDAVFLRAGVSRGYVAPSLFELHSVGEVIITRLEDPCSLSENVAVLPGCNQLSDSLMKQFYSSLSGNKKLQSEESENLNMGISLGPDWLDGFSISADYYSINIDNVISSVSAGQLVTEAAAGRSAGIGNPSPVVRNSQGNIKFINTSYANMGSRRVDSLDLALKAEVDHGATGRWAFHIQATRMLDYRDQSQYGYSDENLTGTYISDVIGGNGALPQWKGWAQLSWENTDIALDYRVFYIDSTTEQVPYQDREREIDSWLTHNVQLSYNPSFFDALSLTVGVENIADRSAPYVASSFNNGLDARSHNLKGRYFYGQVGFNW